MDIDNIPRVKSLKTYIFVADFLSALHALVNDGALGRSALWYSKG